jgi:hypothetical protein
MGEDITPAAAELESKKPEHKLDANEVLISFELVIEELVGQARLNPEGLGDRIAGFALTFLDRYGAHLDTEQRDALYSKRDELIRQLGRSR